VCRRPTRLYYRLTPLTPSLAPTQACGRARLTRGAPPRRHSRSWRPPCLAAGAPSRRSLPGPSKQGNRPPGTQGPSPAHARPAVRRNLSKPPPVGAQGPHCEATVPSEGLSAKQGHICKESKTSRAFADSCKLRRKSSKNQKNAKHILLDSW
jgi:hypothetical protein